MAAARQSMTEAGRIVGGGVRSGAAVARRAMQR
jgi:hypothetical protein